MFVCAIHQPNFFPWSGFFDKINKADVFIFMDDVAYPKSGSGSGSWCNRVKLLSGGQPAWYGLPIKKEPGVQLIKDVYFAEKEFHLGKFKKSLLHNYGKAPFYQQTMTQLLPLIDYKSDSLAEYNINAIIGLAQLLGLKTKFIRQSDLPHQHHSTVLLIELVKAVEANAYLCGNGAGGYQDDGLFAENGIELIYQNYDPVKTGLSQIIQANEIGLSVLHTLFTRGIQA